MPAGNITTIDRIERLKEIKRLKEEEGLGPSQIAEELQLPLATVKRNLYHLEEFNVSDLLPEDRAKKRLELELEYKIIIEKAREQFEYWKDDKPNTANSYLIRWESALNNIAKIYGLENIKVDSFTQINQLNQYEVQDKLDTETAKKIADAIKKKHEERV